MENKKFDPMAETQIALKASEVEEAAGLRAKPLSTSRALSMDIQKQRSRTTGKLLAFMAGVGLGAAGGIAGTYGVMRHGGDSESRTVAVSPAVSESASNFTDARAANAETNAQPEKDDLPDTPEKLAKILAELKIKATEANFSQKGGALQIRMVEKEMENAADPAVKTSPDANKYRWIEVPHLIKDSDILIAIKVEKGPYLGLLQFIGAQPLSKIADSDNPQIIYAYYHCSDSASIQSRGAAAVLMDPAVKNKPHSGINGGRGKASTRNPSPFLVTKSFTLPKC